MADTAAHCPETNLRLAARRRSHANPPTIALLAHLDAPAAGRGCAIMLAMTTKPARLNRRGGATRGKP
jgi:hypothetical protein